MEGAIDQTGEDGIGGHEEATEDDDERHGDEQSARRGDGVTRPTIARNLAPLDVGKDERQTAKASVQPGPRQPARVSAETREFESCAGRAPRQEAERAERR